MNAVEFAQLLRVLSDMRSDFRRMADAAETQAKETKAMRKLVEDQHEEEIRKEWNS